MIRADQIPDKVVEAAARAIYNILEGPVANQDYVRQCRQWEQSLSLARASIIAALQAWPGMMPVSEVFTAGGDFYRPHLILPLPQDACDE